MQKKSKNEIVAANLYKFRIAKGKKQQELADVLDITLSAYSKIESGKTKINVNQLALLANYLGVSETELLTETNLPSKETIAEEQIKKDFYKNANQLFELLLRYFNEKK